MPDFDPQDPFGSLMEELTTELGHIGLHTEAMSIVGAPDLDEDETEEDDDEFSIGITPDDIVEQIKSSRGNFALAVRAYTKDLAFDEKTLHPEKFAQDTEAKTIMPSTHEMLREEIERQLADGVAYEDVVIPEIYKLGLETDDDIDE